MSALRTTILLTDVDHDDEEEEEEDDEDDNGDYEDDSDNEDQGWDYGLTKMMTRRMRRMRQVPCCKHSPSSQA